MAAKYPFRLASLRRPKTSSGSDHGPGHGDDRLVALRRECLDALWTASLRCAAVSAPLSVSRALVTGWLPTYTIHVALALMVVLVVVARDRISPWWQSFLFLAMLCVIGMAGIVPFGLAAAGTWWPALSCLVAGTLYSVRVGLYVAVGSGLMMGLTGFAFMRGWLAPVVDLNQYNSTFGGWAIVLVGGGVFTYFVLRAIGIYNASIVDLLRQVERQKGQIEWFANHDPLTGLPSSRLADERVERAIGQARTTGRKVALMFIDLDGFKAVNDTLGHEAGDKLLQEGARRLSRAIRADDTVARVGGDEFLVVVGGMGDAALAQDIAQKIVDLFAEPFLWDGLAQRVGASVGIALFPDHADNPTDLRRLADRAMYQVKRNRKGGWLVVA